MRVCVPTTSFPRWRGDHAGCYVHELVRHFVAAGIEPVVVAPRGPLPDGSSAPRAEEWDGVRIVRFRYSLARGERLAYGDGIPANLRARPLRTLAQLPIFAVAFACAVRRAAAGCGLVHANWVFSALVARWSVPRLPVVLTVRGTDVNGLPVAGPVGRVVNGTLRRCRAVVALSASLAAGVAARGVARERIHVVPNGVDLPALGATRRYGASRVLWVGRMVAVKDLATLVRSFALVHGECPAARLILVGDGVQRHTLRHLVQTLGLTEAVEFAGMVPADAVRQYYLGADVFALSSTAEGGGNAVLEAMAHGLPVVATRVGWAAELVRDGENGRLVPPGDADAMARAILSVLASAEACERMGRAARRAVEPLSWQRAAQEYLRIFTLALAAPRGAPAPERQCGPP